MKYSYLGNSGLAVSRICLGTMTFGQENWGCDEPTSHSILDTFVEQGGNFIDTADKYVGTLTEQIIGRWLTGQDRDSLVIATKCFFPTSEDVNARGLSRKHIMAACESSLTRLGTDHIDLYQAHAPDPQSPIEETLSAFDTLIRQGKVRYAGFSNFPAWLVVKASGVCRERGLAPLISGQYLYNLLKRDIEAEVLPACSDSGVGVLCWSPLSGGMLTGKYADPAEPPKDTRIANRSALAKNRYASWFEKSRAIVSKLVETASSLNVLPSTIALSWVLSRSEVTSAIVGAREPHQIFDNAKAGDFLLPEQILSELNELSVMEARYPVSWIDENHKGWFSACM